VSRNGFPGWVFAILTLEFLLMSVYFGQCSFVFVFVFVLETPKLRDIDKDS